MSALSIAHVLSSFDTGGQERVALDLAMQQRAHGHRVLAVSLASRPEGALADGFRAADVATLTVPKRPGFDPTLPFRLAKLMAARGVNVVHSHNPHALIYGAPAARLLQVAAVHTKHGLNADGARRRWLRRAASRYVDAYVAVTPKLGQVALENSECAPERLHVVPNGIDEARFAPNAEARRRTRATLGIPQDAWVVGTVGRLSPEKDQALLIDAMSPLLAPERQLLIVGDGPEREPLSLRIAATWRSELVHLVGAHQDPENWLAAFDVFALSSRSEGLPLVVLEAMAMGIPVVCTAVGGVPDVVEPGVTGTLIAARDRPALAAQLAWLATRPAAARQMAETAQQRVLERYTTRRMASDYLSLYESLLRSQKVCA